MQKKMGFENIYFFVEKVNLFETAPFLEILMYLMYHDIYTLIYQYKQQKKYMVNIGKVSI